MKSPEEKTPWWRNKATLVSAGLLVTGVVKETLGLDLGADNVGNVAVGTAAIGCGAVLAWKGLKPIISIVGAWWKARASK